MVSWLILQFVQLLWFEPSTIAVTDAVNSNARGKAMMCPDYRRSLRSRGRFLFASIALATVIVAGQVRASDSDHSPLVGTWRLTKFVDTPEGGQPVYAFGKDPIGFFAFTADGHVFMNIMRNPPNAPLEGVDPDPDSCVPEWFCAYFGTYTLDAKKGIWVTHVLGSNLPNYLGTNQTRSFTLRGDTLVISESYSSGGKRVQAERRFVRER